MKTQFGARSTTPAMQSYGAGGGQPCDLMSHLSTIFLHTDMFTIEKSQRMLSDHNAYWIGRPFWKLQGLMIALNGRIMVEG